jgi:4-methyl-5(b-hydroxyethyl)-thiazole monophosphate biosynthesis
LAQGFEEIEALTIVDILRRAGVEVVTAGLDDKPVEASRKTRHLPDTRLDAVVRETFDAVVLPGGQPGTNHLKADPRILECLQRHARAGKWVAAICAAPMVLHAAGLIEGKKVTSYPSVRDQLGRVDYVEDRVAVDGRVVTSRGPGTAMEFSLRLVELLCGMEKAREVRQAVLM